MKSVAFLSFLGAGNMKTDSSLEMVVQWFSVKSPRICHDRITSDSKRMSVQYALDSVATSLFPPEGTSEMWHKVRRLLSRAMDVSHVLGLKGIAHAVFIQGMWVIEEFLPASPCGFRSAMNDIASAFRLQSSPFVLWDAGADQPIDLRGRVTYRFTRRPPTHASCGDRLSARVVQPWLDYSLHVDFDLVFAYRAPVRQEVEPNSVAMGGDWKRACRGIREISSDYDQVMDDVVVQLLQLGHVVTPTGGDDADQPVAGGIRDALTPRAPSRPRRLRLVHPRDFCALTDPLSPAEVIAISLELGLVRALSAGRPTVCLVYADQCTLFLSEWGLSGFAHDIIFLGADAIVEDMLRAASHRHAIHGQLEELLRSKSADLKGPLNATRGAHMGFADPGAASSGASR